MVVELDLPGVRLVAGHIGPRDPLRDHPLPRKLGGAPSLRGSNTIARMLAHSKFIIQLSIPVVWVSRRFRSLVSLFSHGLNINTLHSTIQFT